MTSEQLEISRTRLRWATYVVGIAVIVLVAQMIRWTVVPHATPATQSPRKWIPNVGYVGATPKTRGNVLDANGALLVTTGYLWEISLAPESVTRQADREEVGAALAPYLENYTAQQLAGYLEGDGKYLLLDRVDYETGVAIRELTLQPVGVDAIPMRVYPEGDLAAHILGFVNRESNLSGGVERAYDDYLQGEVHLDWVEDGKPLTQIGIRFEQNASPDGTCDLILTIDRAIQYRTEAVLRRTIANTGAAAGTILVMDPRNGALLASASYPTYTPAEYYLFSEETWRDPAVSEQYEPGSIFKIVTMGAGLHSGAIRPTDTYIDEGCIDVGEQTICNLNNVAYGMADMQDVLLYSLNMGSSYVSRKMGPEDYYGYVERFGFGELTGIDLAGESRGQVRWPGGRNWHEVDLVTNSFGQGVAVTPIQMISAVSAVANDGYLMKPHVVQGMIGQGHMIEIEPTRVRQVISEKAAHTLTDMLVNVVDEGSLSARVPGYSVAGKSGTAEIAEAAGYAEDTIAGFVGYLPASDPALVILVKIVQPKGETLGSKVAAPVFSELAGELVSMMGIPPDRPIKN